MDGNPISGVNPTAIPITSHSTNCSVPGIGWNLLSTSATIAPLTPDISSFGTASKTVCPTYKGTPALLTFPAWTP